MSDKSIVRLSASPEGFGETPEELTQNMFNSAIPIQHLHSCYEDEDIGLFIGVWDTDTMVETAGPYGCDEFMWIIEGECQIKNNKTGAIETAKAGESFIIPKGYDCQWHQTGYLRKFYVISEHPAESIPTEPAFEGIIIPKANAELSAMNTPAPFSVTSGAVGEEYIYYSDVTGKFISGIWAADAFEAEHSAFPYNEFAYVQAGTIILTDDSGVEHRFNAGDAFFIPEGVNCNAKVTDSVKLFFAIVKSV